MGISLISDFSDYYDVCLGSMGEKRYTLNRMASRVPREESLKYLSNNKNSLIFGEVIEHGQTSVFAEKYPGKTEVVVYRDGIASNGLGLLRMPLEHALKTYAGGYCSRYAEGKGATVVHLVLGSANYLLLKKSRSSWKSNTGDVVIREIATWTGELHQHFPLYYVSYVLEGDNLYAIHLNTAPRLKGLVDIEPRVVCNLLHEWFSAKGE